MKAGNLFTFNFNRMGFWRLIRVSCIYLLPMILVVGAVEWKLSGLETEGSRKKHLFETRLSEYEILVLGTSTAFRGVDPGMFSRPGFNLAHHSQSLFYSWKLTEKYVSQMGSLKKVLLVVDPFDFEFSLSDSQEYWRQFSYERIYGLPLESSRHAWDSKRWSWTRYYGGYFSPQRLMRKKQSGIATEMQETGYWPTGSGTKDFLDEAFIKKRIALLRENSSTHQLDKNRVYLEEIAALLQKHHVELILVTPPVTIEFAAQMDMKQYERMQSMVKQLTDQRMAIYYNYLRDNRFGSGDFYDVDHLSAQGAEKFSKILNREVLGA